MSDGRNRNDQNESGAQPSDAINYLGHAGLAHKVNKQSDAGEGENNSEWCEPLATGGACFFVHLVKAGSKYLIVIAKVRTAMLVPAEIWPKLDIRAAGGRPAASD